MLMRHFLNVAYYTKQLTQFESNSDMKKNNESNKTKENEFDRLKKIGFEFEAPQDEPSYQPDSSSTVNGEIGKQEYGIDVVLDAQGDENRHMEEADKTENPTTPIPGESEWSQKHRLPDESFEKKHVSEIDKASR